MGGRVLLLSGRKDWSQSVWPGGSGMHGLHPMTAVAVNRQIMSVVHRYGLIWPHSTTEIPWVNGLSLHPYSVIPFIGLGRSWHAFTEDSIRFRNSNSDNSESTPSSLNVIRERDVILIALLGGINGPDNGDHCIVVTLWPMLHKRAEMASEAENAKQMSAYKHLLSPGLVH